MDALNRVDPGDFAVSSRCGWESRMAEGGHCGSANEHRRTAHEGHSILYGWRVSPTHKYLWGIKIPCVSCRAYGGGLTFVFLHGEAEQGGCRLIAVLIPGSREIATK